MGDVHLRVINITTGPQNPFYAGRRGLWRGHLRGRGMGKVPMPSARSSLERRTPSHASRICMRPASPTGLSGAAFVLDSRYGQKRGAEERAIIRCGSSSRVLRFSKRGEHERRLNSLGYVLLELLLSPALYPEDYAAITTRRTTTLANARRRNRLRHLKLRDYCANEEAGTAWSITGHDGRRGRFLGLALGRR